MWFWPQNPQASDCDSNCPVHSSWIPSYADPDRGGLATFTKFCKTTPQQSILLQQSFEKSSSQIATSSQTPDLLVAYHRSVVLSSNSELAASRNCPKFLWVEIMSCVFLQNMIVCFFLELQPRWLQPTEVLQKPTASDLGPKSGTQGRCGKPCCNSREQFTHNLPRPKIHPQIFRPFPPWSLGAHGWMWIKMGRMRMEDLDLFAYLFDLFWIFIWMIRNWKGLPFRS